MMQAVIDACRTVSGYLWLREAHVDSSASTPLTY